MIQKITVDIATTNHEGASTKGAVYLGLGGREFRLDIDDHDDFHEGDEVSYVFGVAANVLFPDRNDPRKGLPLSLGDATRHPVYIRLEPQGKQDDWEIANVSVRVAALSGEVAFAALQGPGESLWLGRESGTILYLPAV